MTIAKKTTVVTLLIIFFGCLSSLYAQPMFRADPAVVENLKTLLLEEQGVDQPDQWRPAAYFHVQGQYRPSFFSFKISYDLKAKVTLEETTYRGQAAFKGIIHLPDMTKTFVLRKRDLNPLYTHMMKTDGSHEVSFSFSDQKILFKETIQGQTYHRVIKAPDMGHYYESELLGFVLVAYPFDFSGAQYFDMFYYDTCKHYRVEVECEGVGQINVPAGEFATYRLRVNPTGILSLFSTNYAWYDKDPPHYLIKGKKNIWWYLNETWELIKVDMERKGKGDRIP